MKRRVYILQVAALVQGVPTKVLSGAVGVRRKISIFQVAATAASVAIMLGFSSSGPFLQVGEAASTTVWPMGYGGGINIEDNELWVYDQYSSSPFAILVEEEYADGCD